MESCLTTSLWSQPSGPQIRCSTAQPSASRPALVKSRIRSEPGCSDLNPQLTECSATGRGVSRHGKHSLGHKRSRGIGPGLEPMLLNIPQNQRFPFFPFLSLLGLFYPARAEAWYRFEPWNLSDSKTVTTVKDHNGGICSYLSCNEACLQRAFNSAEIKVKLCLHCNQTKHRQHCSCSLSNAFLSHMLFWRLRIL